MSRHHGGPSTPSGPASRGVVFAVTAKGLDGAASFLCGLMLMALTPSRLHAVVVFLTQAELMEDPHDLAATQLLRATSERGVAGGAVLPVVLLFYGATTVVLAVGILLSRDWAHPCMIVWMTTSMGYQICRFAMTPARGLLAHIIFDGAVLTLIWRQHVRQHRRAQAGT